MKAVLTRVSKAKVTVDGEVVGSITAEDTGGILALVGVGADDVSGGEPNDKGIANNASWKKMAKKIAELRILAGEKSALDLGAPIPLVRRNCQRTAPFLGPGSTIGIGKACHRQNRRRATRTGIRCRHRQFRRDDGSILGESRTFYRPRGNIMRFHNSTVHEELADASRMISRYTGTPWILSGSYPRLLPLQWYWEQLHSVSRY